MTDYIPGISHNEQDAAATEVMTSGSQILIGGKKFKAITTITLTDETIIAKRRLEDQTEIADHAVANPTVQSFELELFSGEYEILAALNTKKTPFTLVTHRGVFDNMIISKLSDIVGQESTETTKANVTVEQIRIGKSRAVKNTINTAAVTKPVTAVSEEIFPGSGPLKFVSIRTLPKAAPVRQENQPALTYCDGLAEKMDALRSMNRSVPRV